VVFARHVSTAPAGLDCASGSAQSLFRWLMANGVLVRWTQVAEVRAVVAMMPAMPHYPSTSRHSIRSRAWGASLQGCSFKVHTQIASTSRTASHHLCKWGGVGRPAEAVYETQQPSDRQTRLCSMIMVAIAAADRACRWSGRGW
jgi:hypothetical protein